MPGIGAYNFVTLKGEINPGSGHQMEEITRPGVDGVAFRRIGRRGFPFKVQSMVDVATDSAAAALLSSYKALQGTVVSLTDETGQVWNNIVVLNVRPAGRKYVVAKSGGLDAGQTGYLVRCEWMLQATETT